MQAVLQTVFFDGGCALWHHSPRKGDGCATLGPEQQCCQPTKKRGQQGVQEGNCAGGAGG
eukprot:scaffold308483_cov15-Tisochrysis_lutea.AAC.1